MTSHRLTIGLTGGIGSGKSEVSRCFENLNIVVVDADIVAREVVAIGSFALKKITAHFGEAILLSSGALNRPLLREIIFNNPLEKTWLEQLLHPIIRQSIVDQLAGATSPYAILSSPLLLETSQYELVSRVLVIDAPPELQLARASARDQNSTAQIQKIMATQMERQHRLALADDVIHNHNSLEDLHQQVQALHKQYLSLL